MLRVRAGQPSIREITQIIGLRDKGSPMGRSTIQDKLSGKSAPTLAQVMSLVNAFAEYAHTHGIPLPPDEIEQSKWRELVAAQISAPPPLETGIKDSTSWNLEPFRRAQMFDVLEIVERNHKSPPATWLVDVIRPMLKAKMDFSEFIRRAATEDPASVVQTVKALDSAFPEPSDLDHGQPIRPTRNDLTAGKLIWHAALEHGAQATPAIVAGLRREGLERHAWTFLGDVARTLAPIYLAGVLEDLKTARLSTDENWLLTLAGAKRKPHRVYEVITYFDRNDTRARDKVLKGICKWDCDHLEVVVERLAEKFDNRFTDTIIQGIPRENALDYAEKLRLRGSNELADLVSVRADDPASA
ncbi:hypothetical protein [Streptomyces lasalocidi]|uniref:Uncharacterized protein n=1 Tax=Streptomyces lasalocidi TaxID=324833 RepID=A0A4U5WI46_STRLS|nr:hypothetical protein [Streptomyces lasalocidi]TKT01647.1 hypothetical protein E4U91_17150 [Streptomyces lasalocidi]